MEYVIVANIPEVDDPIEFICANINNVLKKSANIEITVRPLSEIIAC